MNTYNKLAVIVLAAGKGTRMKSDLAKVLHKVAGKSMVNHVIGCARKLAPEHIHVVVGHQAGKVKEDIEKYFKVGFSLQKELKGTGDAVRSALPDLADPIEDVLVLCGDVPLIQEDTLGRLVKDHIRERARVTVLAVDVENPLGYGRIVLDEQKNMVCIREEADANEDEKEIKKVNTGIYCFNRAFLVSAIDQIKPDNNQAEYYLTDLVEIARSQGDKIHVVSMDDPRQVIGVNTLDELTTAGALILQLENELS